MSVNIVSSECPPVWQARGSEETWDKNEASSWYTKNFSKNFKSTIQKVSSIIKEKVF